MTDDEIRKMIKNSSKLTDHEVLTLIAECNILLDKISNIKEKNKAVVIDPTCDSNIFPILSLDFLQTIVKLLGIKFELDDNWETNGWQCDWWSSFEHNGNPFIFSGGLFSNNISINFDVDKINDEC